MFEAEVRPAGRLRWEWRVTQRGHVLANGAAWGRRRANKQAKNQVRYFRERRLAALGRHLDRYQRRHR